ncbi:nitroimidazol reductase NimA-like FMN-containing flavoprotein (pyridoxamine 5'-phosphate oxidase superfamily) [Kribbella sp. VKM Ac-2569]|uniref:pyridoxamine 5'-phosphate oxidase family protein n=1 Tax=Kribbella sp. VKM Ac-2569 TaxID=2512220 RepID=UPI00102CFD13|nr:pyridoxamine 5'-phosphate oxidase family protein [Kribbella sp. VKM Ac-2569]RZT20595.1 nitroimidazol reductase NimA-like FMN-containing flavoprotein (pyridoxamine 5'-phosphate oxidase superfamily) [Kribbella sp. VKM Ac-2569]
MSQRLSRTEREAFLSDVRIGVLSVDSDQPDRAPVSAPVWYGYTPEAGVWVIMNGRSRKGTAIETARRFVLVVQSETIPYRYVTVEGPVTEIRATDTEKDLLPLAIRYLGEQRGRSYAKEWEAAGSAETDLVYVMKPTHWNTADFTDDLA